MRESLIWQVGATGEIWNCMQMCDNFNLFGRFYCLNCTQFVFAKLRACKSQRWADMTAFCNKLPRVSATATGRCCVNTELSWQTSQIARQTKQGSCRHLLFLLIALIFLCCCCSKCVEESSFYGTSGCLFPPGNLCLMSEVSIPCPAVDPLLLSALGPDLYILTFLKSLRLKKRNMTDPYWPKAEKLSQNKDLFEKSSLVLSSLLL